MSLCLFGPGELESFVFRSVLLWQDIRNCNKNLGVEPDPLVRQPGWIYGVEAGAPCVSIDNDHRIIFSIFFFGLFVAPWVCLACSSVFVVMTDQLKNVFGREAFVGDIRGAPSYIGEKGHRDIAMTLALQYMGMAVIRCQSM